MVEWEATDPDIGSRHSLPAMRLLAHRVSAADPQIPHPGAGQHSFRAQNFPEGILLPGLPFHLDERRPSAALSFLEPVLFRTGEAGIAAPLPSPVSSGSLRAARASDDAEIIGRSHS